MAGDSTELTFVRCPSCRSLVPAMSTRCRMCGATLDGSQKVDQSPKDATKQGRVRQRTMSNPGDVLNAATEELRNQTNETPSSSVDNDHPVLNGTSQTNATEISVTMPGAGADEGILIDDPLGAYVEEVPVESSGLTAATPVPEREELHVRGFSDAAKVETKPVLSEAAERRAEPVPPARVKINKEARREEAKATSEQMKSVAGKSSSAATTTPQAQVGAREGRLFGWLVSFTDDNGRATEIREGRFFVTRSSLKSSDLVIDDASISTPHAMIRAEEEGKLEVQDLMSDRGIFVRKSGADAYKREEDRARLAHGDWVRFGDIEYLVSLIAHVGKKN
jgi:hypothetical protein